MTSKLSTKLSMKFSLKFSTKLLPKCPQNFPWIVHEIVHEIIYEIVHENVPKIVPKNVPKNVHEILPKIVANRKWTISRMTKKKSDIIYGRSLILKNYTTKIVLFDSRFVISRRIKCWTRWSHSNSCHSFTISNGWFGRSMCKYNGRNR